MQMTSRTEAGNICSNWIDLDLYEWPKMEMKMEQTRGKERKLRSREREERNVFSLEVWAWELERFDETDQVEW